MSNNNKNNMSGDLGPWIFVIACLFIFPPLGFILLLGKLRTYAKQVKRSQEYTYTQPPAPAAQTAPAASRNAVKNEKARRAQSKEPKVKDAGRRENKLIPFLLLLAAIALVILGAEHIYTSVRDMALSGATSNYIWDLIRGAFYCAGGLVSFTVRGVLQRRSRKFRTYKTLVGRREVVPVADIASAAGASEKSVRRTLQAMIDNGWFGEGAYIDAGLGSLVISAEAAEAARQASKPPEPSTVAGTENQYMAIIRELQELNVTIIDESISNKVDRIEYVTAQIFRTVEENPNKLPQIRRFMSYYLPTTLKLLHAYATLEKQGIQGENISGAKQNIDRILDTLSKGFEQQLDMLFKSDVIDISSDISVLENMMKQDGLADGGMMMMTDNG